MRGLTRCWRFTGSAVFQTSCLATMYARLLVMIGHLHVQDFTTKFWPGDLFFDEKKVGGHVAA